MSNSTITGTVSLVYKKVTDSGAAYSIKMDDNEWYSAGFAPPQCKKGDSVQFEMAQKGQYKNVVKGSLKVVGESSTAPAPAPAALPTVAMTQLADAAKLTSKATGWKEDPAKDFRIMYLASQKVAADVVLACVAAGTISIPKSTKKPVELISALIHECSVDLLLTAGGFFEDTPTLELLLKSVNEPAEAKSINDADFDDSLDNI